MIDKEILDAVIPVPTLEEAKDEKVAELKEEGFVVTNFHSGGVFYTLLMVELRIKIELLQLARRILNNMFVTHAEGVWLEIKVLKDATLNNMVNNVFLKNFDSVTAVAITSGIYDPVARKIYV